jgi:RNA polymerase sigma-70 factor (ECF subfamily)
MAAKRREHPLEETAAPETIEADTALRERRALMRRALRHLSVRERAALVLRDLEGLPTREVAAILGTSEATVRSQTAGARLKLKRFLEGLVGRRV